MSKPSTSATTYLEDGKRPIDLLVSETEVLSGVAGMAWGTD